MFNSISVAALLDSNQELSLDDLDLVLGGNNATSATGSGDDDQRQPMAGLTSIPTLTNVPVDVKVDIRSTETHTDGGGPFSELAATVRELGHEAADLAHKAGDIVYDTIHPIGQALGQLGHDVIMVIDQHVTGTSPSSGTGH